MIFTLRDHTDTTIKIRTKFRNLWVTLPMPRVTLLRRPARSGWLQGMLTGIGLQRPVCSPNEALELAVVQPAKCER